MSISSPITRISVFPQYTRWRQRVLARTLCTLLQSPTLSAPPGEIRLPPVNVYLSTLPSEPLGTRHGNWQLNYHDRWIYLPGEADPNIGLITGVPLHIRLAILMAIAAIYGINNSPSVTAAFADAVHNIGGELGQMASNLLVASTRPVTQMAFAPGLCEACAKIDDVWYKPDGTPQGEIPEQWIVVDC